MRTRESTGVTDRLLAEQHSLPLSIALHLVPGGLIVAAYLLVASPLVRALGYPPYLGWVLAMCLALAPVQLGLLAYLGKKRNGKRSLRGVVRYLEKPTTRGRLVGLTIALIASVLVASAVLAPVDTVVHESLFSWLPFEGTAGASGFLAGYPRSTIIVTLALSLLLTGLILPAIEELYFRGYLLDRISHLGGWAPVLNTVLFSLYHFWTPWQFLSRIGFFLPTVWVTWRQKDLRISVLVHCLANTLVQSAVLVAVVSGLA